MSVRPVSIFRTLLAAVCRDERGASIVEYALLASLVAVVCLFSVRVLGTDIKSQVTSAGTQITAADRVDRGR